MSQGGQDPPLTEVPPSVNAPGPSVAIDIFDDATEYRTVKCYQKLMPIDKAYKEAVKQVEKGQGHWGRTNVTLLNEASFDFKLTCSSCDKEHYIMNPPNFWKSHFGEKAQVCGDVSGEHTHEDLGCVWQGALPRSCAGCAQVVDMPCHNMRDRAKLVVVGPHLHFRSQRSWHTTCQRNDRCMHEQPPAL